MLKKILLFFLIVTSQNLTAYEITLDDLRILLGNWTKLVPDGAYDFVPEEVTYEIYSDKKFQEKLKIAAEKLNNTIDESKIKLAGYMVPVEMKKGKVSKFLLVPEAGQCIHVPPPPLNQTVLVEMEDKLAEEVNIYKPIIVSGSINVGSNSFDVADSGYIITSAEVSTIEIKK